VHSQVLNRVLTLALKRDFERSTTTSQIIRIAVDVSDVSYMAFIFSGFRYLSALYHEALHLVSSLISLRHVPRPTRTAAQKLLRQDNKFILA
jgi:hypothetical protein